VPILGSVAGDELAAVLTAAQSGSEAALTLLWRDANPALLRYLRVIAPDAAEDIAAETWLQVVRGLPGFRGDQSDWRAWLFTTARRRAIDETRRRARRPTSPLDDLEPGQRAPSRSFTLNEANSPSPSARCIHRGATPCTSASRCGSAGGTCAGRTTAGSRTSPPGHAQVPGRRPASR
jgi:predicted RNA polymerase sigma factor